MVSKDAEDRTRELEVRQTVATQGYAPSGNQTWQWKSPGGFHGNMIELSKMGEFYIAMSDYRRIDFFNVEPDCSGAFNLIKIVGNDAQ